MISNPHNLEPLNHPVEIHRLLDALTQKRFLYDSPTLNAIEGIKNKVKSAKNTQESILNEDEYNKIKDNPKESALMECILWMRNESLDKIINIPFPITELQSEKDPDKLQGYFEKIIYAIKADTLKTSLLSILEKFKNHFELIKSKDKDQIDFISNSTETDLDKDNVNYYLAAKALLDKYQKQTSYTFSELQKIDTLFKGSEKWLEQKIFEYRKHQLIQQLESAFTEFGNLKHRVLSRLDKDKKSISDYIKYLYPNDEQAFDVLKKSKDELIEKLKYLTFKNYSGSNTFYIAQQDAKSLVTRLNNFKSNLAKNYEEEIQKLKAQAQAAGMEAEKLEAAKPEPTKLETVKPGIPKVGVPETPVPEVSTPTKTIEIPDTAKPDVVPEQPKQSIQPEQPISENSAPDPAKNPAQVQKQAQDPVKNPAQVQKQAQALQKIEDNARVMQRQDASSSRFMSSGYRNSISSLKDKIVVVTALDDAKKNQEVFNNFKKLINEAKSDNNNPLFGIEIKNNSTPEKATFERKRDDGSKDSATRVVEGNAVTGTINANAKDEFMVAFALSLAVTAKPVEMQPYTGANTEAARQKILNAMNAFKVAGVELNVGKENAVLFKDANETQLKEFLALANPTEKALVEKSATLTLKGGGGGSI